MPVETHSAGEALAIRRKNARAKWPGRNAAGAHFFPIAIPAFAPKSALSKDDKIFCIGSCFAREIEAVLARLGYTILSKPEVDPPTGRIDQNKYTLPSILNELRHVFEPETYPREPFVITAPDGTAADYQLTGELRSRGPELAQVMGRAASSHFARIKQADFIVLTLGYSEVWHDHNTGLDLNRAPTRALIDAEPERFALRVLSADDNAQHLRQILDLLAHHIPQGLRGILTVSPVPLQSTFRDCDVMLANAYSKAALRCAVDAVLPDYDWLDYFPSYEMATLSTPELVWSEDDFRHLNRDFVTLIMCHVLDGLIAPAAQSHTAEQSDAQARLLARYTHGNRSKVSRLRTLEAKLMRQVLSDSKLRKYRRDRSAFFEDSKNKLARWYWRRTR